jgi:hypothetical protein
MWTSVHGGLVSSGLGVERGRRGKLEDKSSATSDLNRRGVTHREERREEVVSSTMKGLMSGM